MSHTKKRSEKTLEMRLHVPASIKERVRKYRAQKQLNDEPITSDSSAILQLVEIGLESIALNA